MLCILWVWSLDSWLIIFLWFIFLLLEDKQWFKFGEVDMHIICISFLIINLGFWTKFRIYSLMIWDFQSNIQLIGDWFILNQICVQGSQFEGELDPTWGCNLDPTWGTQLGESKWELVDPNWSWFTQVKSIQSYVLKLFKNQSKPSHMWSSQPNKQPTNQPYQEEHLSI